MVLKWNWLRNLCGDVAFKLLTLTYDKDEGHYVVSWLASKFKCFDIIDQKKLLLRVMKGATTKTAFSGWSTRDSTHHTPVYNGHETTHRW